MANTSIPDQLRKHEIPGCVALASGAGGMPKIKISSKVSAAEIYLHGAHVTGFQKNSEPPLLFMSRKSWFESGKPIRGGVPVCLPWFGARDGEPAHGFARILPWELVDTSTAQHGAVTLRLRLPKNSLKSEWSSLKIEFVVTVADTLAMELIATNESADRPLEIENCLHTYFHVGDIARVSILGLEQLPFDDFVCGGKGAQTPAENSVLRIARETNRVYPNHVGVVEIRDEQSQRTIRVEKSGSNSTVVWNPWTTQKLPDDFDPAEHLQMVCVESGNVKKNKILLAPGGTTTLKVVLSSAPLK